MLRAVLERPRAIFSLFFVFFLAGIFTYNSIPRESDPDIDVPVFYVAVSAPGISAKDADRLLVKPMESSLRALPGLKNLFASASNGHAGIVLEFSIDFEKEQALADVRAKVDSVRAKLPEVASEPVILETNFSEFPVIVVALSGELPERTIADHARLLRDQIETIPQVLGVDIAGLREEVLEVEVDILKLESFGIAANDLLTAISRNNRLITAGNLNGESGRFAIKIDGLFQEIADIEAIPIRSHDGGVVRIGDIASIRRTFEDTKSFSRHNGERAVSLLVKKRTGANIIETNEAVRAIVSDVAATWPPDIRLDTLFDRSVSIRSILTSLQNSVLTAVVLVMALVMVVMGWRAAILVGICIPSAFAIAFVVLGISGISLNVMVLFGMVLTVGLLVDNAIVIVEYGDRKLMERIQRRDAYIRAAERMFLPVMASTATTLAAFLPMLLWPGVSGEFMSFIPIMVIIVLTASFFVSILFVPIVGGMIGKFTGSRHAADISVRLESGAQIGLAELSGLNRAYNFLLDRVIRYSVSTIVLVSALVVGAFAAFISNPTGVEFFVDTEPEQALVFVSARGNLSADQEKRLVQEVEREILKIEGFAAVFVETGSTAPSGMLDGQSPQDAIGLIRLELAPLENRKPGKELLEVVRTRTAHLAGIRVDVRKIDQGPPQGKSIQLEVTHTDYETVIENVSAVRHLFDTELTGLRNVEDSLSLPSIEWSLDVDRTEAGRFGADVASLGSLLQLATTGVPIGLYRPDDVSEEIEIRVRLPKSERTLDRLSDLNIRTANGLVPIRNFASVKPVSAISVITRTNGRYSATISAAVVDGVDPIEKQAEVDAWRQNYSWPPGSRSRFRGADEEQQESQAFLGVIGAGALFLMFMILVTQFNRFSQAVLTISTVVMSVAGVLVGMLIVDQKFSIIMTGIGIVGLAGIVVNNAILLIDTHNRLIAQGVDRIGAIRRSCLLRLRPIILTTATTILGLLPMATRVSFDFQEFGLQYGGVTSVWWVPLATAMIFGLLASSILTLFFIPAVLRVMVRGSLFQNTVLRWGQSLFAGRRADAALGHSPLGEAILSSNARPRPALSNSNTRASLPPSE